ncbi:hypothetical protein [Leptolyngbya sp. NIES-2104]|uniref:hypothetical protein n=1 Tax=Leptolyngbya sp. NIES-2104 TaxID=1552121 RepID=UPI0006ECBD24|nr:hypothetical protein [Leptolyngbya sp. NIES-2104]GAP98390.1 hypothetical protein NIES2104_49450 [Leptolyngbya sp. NIES-2104]
MSKSLFAAILTRPEFHSEAGEQRSAKNHQIHAKKLTKLKARSSLKSGQFQV